MQVTLKNTNLKKNNSATNFLYSYFIFSIVIILVSKKFCYFSEKS